MESTTWENMAKKAILAILVLSDILVGIYAIVGYGLSDAGVAGFARNKENLGITIGSIWRAMLITHAVSGGVALLLGWTQFVGSWIERYRQVHRNVGKLYVTSVMFAGVSGLYLAVYATGGIMAQLGFGMLSLTWLFTGIMAIVTVTRGNIEEHEKWVHRSYAATFAAVTLRIYLVVATGIFGQASYLIYYPVIAWLCWIPNLIFIELFIRNRYRVGAWI